MENDAIQHIAAAAKCPVYEPSDICRLMQRYHLNNKGFALLMNVTPDAVRLWTIGAVRPSGMTRRLMQIYETCPEVVGKLTELTAEGIQDARSD